MTRDVIWARQSTEEKREQQKSLPTQLRRLTEFSESTGGQIVKPFKVDESASSLKHLNDQWEDLTRMARAGEIDRVLITEMTRISRGSPEDYARVFEFRLLGIEIHPLDGSTDPFTQDIQQVLGREEVKKLSQRVKASHIDQVKQGHWQTKRPTGYMIVGAKWNKHLEPHETEAPHVTRAFEMMRDGASSAAVQRYLWANGIELTIRAVRALLKNPVYVGDTVANKVENSRGKFGKRRKLPQAEWIVVADTHAPLVDRDMFAAVGERLKTNKTRQATTRKSEFLLTSLIYCACGEGKDKPSRMYGKQNGPTHPVYYSCYNAAHKATGCENRYAKGIDAKVIAYLDPMFRSFDFAGALAALRAKWDAQAEDVEAQRHHLETRRAKLEEERDTMARNHLLNPESVSEDVYKRLASETAEAIAIIDRELEGLKAPRESAARLNEWREFMETHAADIEAPRRPYRPEDVALFTMQHVNVVHRLIERITVSNDGRYEVDITPTPEGQALLDATKKRAKVRA